MTTPAPAPCAQCGPEFACTDLNACSITELDDVDTTTTPPGPGTVLIWDGTRWVPGPRFACTDLNACSIDNVGDVDTTTTPPGPGTVLVWNGTRWVPGPRFACTDLNACSIDNLGDVDTTTTPPGPGTVLVWNGTTWVPGSPSAFACSALETCSITNLGDVDTTTTPPGPGTVLVWNGTTWVPGPASTFACSQLETCSITNLGDVDTTTGPPDAGDTLVWNGTQWVPGSPTAADCVSADPGNTLTRGADGCLFVPAGGGGATVVQVTDTPSVDLTITGDGTTTPYNISGTVNVAPDGSIEDGPTGLAVCLSTDAGNTLVRGADGCLFVPPGSGGATAVQVTDTPSVNLTITGDGTTTPYDISGVVNVAPGGSITEGPTGLSVCLSTDANNAITRGADGCLYAPAASGGGAVTVGDTPSVNLEGDGTAGNPITATVIPDPAGPVRVGPAGVNVCLSPNAGNTLSLDANGCLFGAPGSGAVPPSGQVSNGADTALPAVNQADTDLPTTWTAPEAGTYVVTVETTASISNPNSQVNWILDQVQTYLKLNGVGMAGTGRTLGTLSWDLEPATVTNAATDSRSASVTRVMTLNAGDTIGATARRDIGALSPTGNAVARVDSISWHKVG